MAAIPVQRIRLVDMPNGQEPDNQPFPITGGQTYIAGALVKLVSGATSECANNDTVILGVADHDAAAVYPSNATAPTASSLFGRTLVGTGTTFFPDEPTKGYVILLHGNQMIEISLAQAWATTLVGTTAGITKDATSGFWTLDNSLANKFFTIMEKADGAPGFAGGVGDTFARVIAAVLPSNTALQL